MTLCTKGMERSLDSHRRRMSWTAEKECVPGVVHSSKEKMVLDGARRVDVDCVDRASQVYPLEALRAAVNKCEYNTFRGKNIFNWLLRRNPMYTGNGFTARSGRRGRTTRTPPAPPFISVAVRPQRSPRQHTPCGFSGVACTVLFGVFVSPSPSVGADSLVGARSYRLRAHPLIDAADTPAHCWCFWHDCRTAPSSWCSGTGGREHGRPISIRWCWKPCQRLADPSDPPTPPASTEIDGTGKALTECQDTSCLLTSLLVKQP
ncbi:hypothetical protein C3747_3g778 [Trypanosoma cruzi]|nr:hypothetical protein C3747_3g778 [Trypanosoma cruzi]